MRPSTFYMVFALFGLVGCGGGDELTRIVTGDGKTQMSAKPNSYGVVTGQNLVRSVGAATRIDIQSSAAYATFTTVKNDLSWVGGKELDVIGYRAAMNFVVKAAGLLVEADALRPLSSVDRVILTPITGSNFDSMSSATVRIAIARHMIMGMTGLPGTEPEVNSLKGAMDELIPLFIGTGNNETNKKACLTMLAAIVLMGNLWHGG